MADLQRLTFLVHPFCYAPSRDRADGFTADLWDGYQARETEVARGWNALIDDLSDADGLVFHPCFESREELELAERARLKLGDRFLRLGSRQELYTPEAMAALAPEISTAFQRRGKYSWAVHDLRVAAFSYHYALDLLAAYQERGITIDTSRLALRAVGESFEGCVTTWTTMVPQFLGAPARVQIPYELTVPDSYFLLGCQYLGRTELACDTALYLFRDGARTIAHFKRERVELADPSYYVRLEMGPGRLSVCTRDGNVLLSPDQPLSPEVPPSLVRCEDGHIEVMVASGRGRGGEGPPYYPREAPLFITAEGYFGDELAAAASKPRVVPVDPL